MAKRSDKPKPHAAQDIGAKAKPFIERMEYLDAEMKAKREEIAEAKKIIIEEVEADGINPKAFKRLLRFLKLQQQIAELPEKDDDIDALAQFAALAEAFGDDSPFGQFARTMAEHGATVSMTVNQPTSTMEVEMATGDVRDDFDRTFS